jgi:hypothetical protein
MTEGIAKYSKAKKRRSHRIILELSDAEREQLDDLVRQSDHESMSGYLRSLLRHTARQITVKRVLE